MTTMYERMLQLPIFQGLSCEQLTEIIEKIPFSFKRFNDGEIIFSQGDPCDSVTFILSGDVRMTSVALDGQMSIVQDFRGPSTMPFYSLFGAETHHYSTLQALDSAGVMQVGKRRFLTMLQNNHIMLVNVMNILSTHAQKQHLAMEFMGAADSVNRLASWMLAYTDRRAVNIEFRATEETWCRLMQSDPVVLWRSVNVLEGLKCVDVTGSNIRLTDRYTLRRFVASRS